MTPPPAFDWLIFKDLTLIRRASNPKQPSCLSLPHSQVLGVMDVSHIRGSVLLIYCLWECVVYPGGCGGQRTAFRSQFSPPGVWVSGMKFMSSGLEPSVLMLWVTTVHLLCLIPHLETRFTVQPSLSQGFYLSSSDSLEARDIHIFFTLGVHPFVRNGTSRSL